MKKEKGKVKIDSFTFIYVCVCVRVRSIFLLWLAMACPLLANIYPVIAIVKLLF